MHNSGEQFYIIEIFLLRNFFFCQSHFILLGKLFYIFILHSEISFNFDLIVLTWSCTSFCSIKWQYESMRKYFGTTFHSFTAPNFHSRSSIMDVWYAQGLYLDTQVSSTLSKQWKFNLFFKKMFFFKNYFSPETNEKCLQFLCFLWKVIYIGRMEAQSTRTRMRTTQPPQEKRPNHFFKIILPTTIIDNKLVMYIYIRKNSLFHSWNYLTLTKWLFNYKNVQNNF